MNPITLDAIRLLLDMQNESVKSTEAQKKEAQKIVDKLLRFIDSDIDAVMEKNSKFLKA